MSSSTDTSLVIAPLWRRLAALFYDCFIIVALGLLYAGSVTGIVSLLGSGPSDNYEQTVSGFWYQFGLFATIHIYYIWCWYKKGQTIGMKTWHIQTVDLSEHKTPSMLLCLLRAFWGSLLVLGGGIGYWYSFFDKDNACLHDKLSKTCVRLTRPTKHKQTDSHTHKNRREDGKQGGETK